MKKIRKGKDIAVRWPILTNGEPESLEGLDLTLFVKSQYNVKQEMPFEIDGNIVQFVFHGKDQTILGSYKLSLYKNYGKEGQNVIDYCDAFSLVSCTCKEGDDDGLSEETVELEPSELSIVLFGGLGVPAGGKKGDVLTKFSDAVNDFGWKKPEGSSAVGTTPVEIVQEPGNSETAVMSQGAVTREISSTNIAVVKQMTEYTDRELNALSRTIGNEYVNVVKRVCKAEDEIANQKLQITDLRESDTTTIAEVDRLSKAVSNLQNSEGVADTYYIDLSSEDYTVQSLQVVEALDAGRNIGIALKVDNAQLRYVVEVKQSSDGLFYQLFTSTFQEKGNNGIKELRQTRYKLIRESGVIASSPYIPLSGVASAELVEQSIAGEQAQRITGDGQTLSAANAYTDTMGSDVRTDMTAGDNAVLAAAKGYTTEQVTEHNASETAHADLRELLATCVGIPKFDDRNYTLTFTANNGAEIIVDFPLETMGLDYDAATKEMIYTNSDGSKRRISLSEFVDVYVGSIGSEIQISIDAGNVIRATLIDGSIDWSKLSLTLKSQIDGKVDKVAGKGLSTEDFTTAEKSKLAGVADGANNYIHPASHPATMIVQDEAHRFVSDSEKSAWNAKVSGSSVRNIAGPMTADEYANLTPDASTLYIITD